MSIRVITLAVSYCVLIQPEFGLIRGNIDSNIQGIQTGAQKKHVRAHTCFALLLVLAHYGPTYIINLLTSLENLLLILKPPEQLYYRTKRRLATLKTVGSRTDTWVWTLRFWSVAVPNLSSFWTLYNRLFQPTYGLIGNQPPFRYKRKYWLAPESCNFPHCQKLGVNFKQRI